MFVHCLDICFNVEHESMDPRRLPREVILAALEKRIQNLRDSDPSEMADAVGVVESYPK